MKYNCNIARVCLLCGQPTTNERIHTGCVVDDIYDTIASGQKVTHLQRSRAHQKNISVDEIRIQVFEDMRGKVHG